MSVPNASGARLRAADRYDSPFLDETDAAMLTEAEGYAPLRESPFAFGEEGETGRLQDIPESEGEGPATAGETDEATDEMEAEAADEAEAFAESYVGEHLESPTAGEFDQEQRAGGAPG